MACVRFALIFFCSDRYRFILKPCSFMCQSACPFPCVFPTMSDQSDCVHLLLITVRLYTGSLQLTLSVPVHLVAIQSASGFPRHGTVIPAFESLICLQIFWLILCAFLNRSCSARLFNLDFSLHSDLLFALSTVAGVFFLISVIFGCTFLNKYIFI